MSRIPPMRNYAKTRERYAKRVPGRVLDQYMWLARQCAYTVCDGKCVGCTFDHVDMEVES